ncbi:hypothetical protein FRACYDRAFT_250547 [Fragilariopsis cylindrus CCMP1102]|uniref:Uncharacterized protein n=1 Tax=Fragilariopsis cylindrus CCMP1102 TaxID=635003 RepID=A0A1E7EPN7_9STRA|nr:hypothetical protein FRACYDRAFT_250547 [Fragilariopsis cylindrus CCMP1102]|eukprot:OEU07922.1 hypothetical protein FRACYDRAFT_250547 [Fragilariopsis cylindrus CCMP1102]
MMVKDDAISQQGDNSTIEIPSMKVIEPEISKNTDKNTDGTNSSEISSTTNPLLKASLSLQLKRYRHHIYIVYTENDGCINKSKSSTRLRLRLRLNLINFQRPPPPATTAIHSPTRSSQKEHRELVMERKEAQKESRTLRRHVVSLNEQLEAAESELQAQRKELERAAERMEKDRVRQKQEKEKTQKTQVQEATLLKTQHEKSVKDQQTRYEEQLEKYRKKLSTEEKKRKKEGGTWDKEMLNATEREHDMREAVGAMEDEKSTLLQQLSTLQGQQTALGLRLESLTQASDNSMERERDAEDRLDAALNQHARQISQRQARESQLERTVQELNAALVSSRNNTRLSGSSSLGDNASSSGSNNAYSEAARISALEMDLQDANSNLDMEKEQLREYDKLSPDNDSNVSTSSFNDDENPNQIKFLSEEVLRLRDKVANQNSVSLSMKNRLKVAVDRSNTLEDQLMVAKTSSNNGDGDVYDSMERARAPISGGRRRWQANPPTMSSYISSGGGERTEQIGQVVDQIDSFAVSTGKYLRRNPLARAGFIFYLILIHLWTFVLLFFHAHSFETTIPNSNFGTVPHSPHAMLQQQQIVRSIDSAAAVRSNIEQLHLDTQGNNDVDRLADKVTDKKVDAYDTP